MARLKWLSLAIPTVEMDPVTENSTPPAHARVTSTDVLKTAALVFILFDHIGYFLAEEWPVLRAIGRLGVPIFFFLIGFAKTRDIPVRWLIIGAVLMGVDFLRGGSLNAVQINILFNFALIRLALPVIERHALVPGWRMLVLVVLLILMIPLVNPAIEYGTEGWLFALMGLLRRRQVDEMELAERWLMPIVGFAAVATFVVVESRDFTFGVLNVALLLVGVLAVKEILARFRRFDLPSQPRPAASRMLRVCGHYSLELYAAQIILLAAAAWLWSIAQ
ncbi:TraX [Rhabdaerophilaceae bacterium]